MVKKIIIGSRGSKLSMAYANRVKSLLLKNSKNLLKTIEIKAVKTSGDIFQNKKISEMDRRGSVWHDNSADFIVRPSRTSWDRSPGLSGKKFGPPLPGGPWGP